MATKQAQAARDFSVAPDHQEIRETVYVVCPRCEQQISDRVNKCGWCGHVRRR